MIQNRLKHRFRIALKVGFISLMGCIWLQCSDAYAIPLKSISIKGLERIDYQVVVEKLPFRVGDDIENPNISNAIKDLYRTQYFLDIKMHLEGNVLKVIVKENPIVKEILFGGVSKKYATLLKTEMTLKERGVYTKDKVKFDAERIKMLFQKSGKLNVAVIPKIEILDRNRVNVLFDIDEGQASRVDSIFFMGNEVISDRQLTLTSVNRGIAKIFFRGKVFEEDSLDVDKSAILQLYVNRGFADVAINYVLSEYEKVTRNFALTFNLSEGELYYIGNLSMETEIDDVDLSIFPKDIFEAEKGDIYRQEIINKIISNMTNHLSNIGRAFVKIEPVSQKDSVNRTIGIKFVIKEADIVYIENINILGTTRTVDNIVRRELLIREGDLYNKYLITRSKDRLRALGYFEFVDIKERKSGEDGRVDLDVIVKDLKQTGNVSLSLGYSTFEAFMLNFGVSKSNIAGRGYSGSLQAMLSLWRRTISLGFSNPHFLGSNISLGFDVSYTNIDPIGLESGLMPLLSSFFFRQNSVSIGIRLGYPILDRLYHSWSFQYRYDSTAFTNPTNNQGSSKLFMDQVTGTYMSTYLSHTIGYDGRDNPTLPNQGAFASLTQTVGLPVPYQLHYVTNDFFGGVYIPLSSNKRWVLSILGRAGANVGYDGSVIPFQYRYSLGYYNMRGFYFSGVGPHVAQEVVDPKTGDTTTNYVGGIGLRGMFYYVASFELRIPTPLPKEYGLNIITFMDVGASFGIDGVPRSPDDAKHNYPEYHYIDPKTHKEITEYVVDSAVPRMALGFGLLYMSPMGPIRLEFAFDVLKQPYDTPLTVRLHFSGIPI